MGDINSILNPNERGLEGSIDPRECDDFRQFMDEVHLGEIVTSGEFFTWTRRSSRIDRAIANEAWVRETNTAV